MLTNAVGNIPYHFEDVPENWPKIDGGRFIAGIDRAVRVGGYHRTETVKRLCQYLGGCELIRPEIEMDSVEAQMIEFGGIRLEKMENGRYRAVDALCFVSYYRRALGRVG